MTDTIDVPDYVRAPHAGRVECVAIGTLGAARLVLAGNPEQFYLATIDGHENENIEPVSQAFAMAFRAELRFEAA